MDSLFEVAGRRLVTVTFRLSSGFSTGRRPRVTESRNHLIGAWHGDILPGTDSSSTCAAYEKLGEYPACPDRCHIVDGGTPCCLIVQPDKNRRYFYKTFKQQEHQRKKPGGRDIHNSQANCTSCQQEGDSGQPRPKISKRHPVRDDAREDTNAGEVKKAEDDSR